MPQRLINVQHLLHDSHNDRPAFLSSPVIEVRLDLLHRMNVVVLTWQISNMYIAHKVFAVHACEGSFKQILRAFKASTYLESVSNDC
jgi:hypothetical protein